MTWLRRDSGMTLQAMADELDVSRQRVMPRHEARDRPIVVVFPTQSRTDPITDDVWCSARGLQHRKRPRAAMLRRGTTRFMPFEFGRGG